MKKTIILLTIFLFIGFATNTFAQKDRRLSNGFSISLVTGFPSANYGLTNDSKMDGYEMPDQYKLDGIWGLKLGNRWYFSPKENYGFGLMVNWIDFSGAAKTGTESNASWTRVVVDLSFLEIGPVGTYAVSDNMALDAYYNLRPTGFGHTVVFSPSSGSGGDETYSYVGVGFSNALGAAFRYKVFNLGIEYIFGGINCDGIYSDASTDNTTLDSQKNMTNSFRILLGIKL